jgi:hypothetical protein
MCGAFVCAYATAALTAREISRVIRIRLGRLLVRRECLFIENILMSRSMHTLFAIELNPTRKGMTSRWALYRMVDGEMVPLWGSVEYDSDHRMKSVSKPYPHMVHTSVHGLPAFHFTVRGYGFDHLHELACSLSRHFGEDVTIIPLNGWRSTGTTVRVANK